MYKQGKKQQHIHGRSGKNKNMFMESKTRTKLYLKSKVRTYLHHCMNVLYKENKSLGEIREKRGGKKKKEI